MRRWTCVTYPAPERRTGPDDDTAAKNIPGYLQTFAVECVREVRMLPPLEVE